MIAVVGPVSCDSANYLKNVFLLRPSLLIALDGGIKLLLDAAIDPDLWIGDMDSAKKEWMESIETKKIPIQQFPKEKDDSDFDLAVQYIMNKCVPQQLALFGMLGGRLDHMLFNLEVVKKLINNSFEVSFRSEGMNIYLLKTGQTIQFPSSKGDIVSLLPWESRVEGITTQGLKYPLKRDILFPSTSRGLSNLVEENQVEIELEKGSLIIFHIKEDHSS